jgi:hypothetical protein
MQNAHSLIRSCLPVIASLALSATALGCEAPVVAEPSGHAISHEEGPAPQPPAPPTGSASLAKPLLSVLFVHWNSTTGDFVSSIDPNDSDPAYKLIGADYDVLNQAQLLPAGQPTVALYRCHDAQGFHFQSLNPACADVAGGTVEGLLGYMWEKDPGDGALRAYRCMVPGGHAAISTVTVEQCSTGGFTAITPLGFAYAFNSNTGGNSRR